MPIQYQIKPDEKLVILVHIGTVNDDEFLSFYKALYENPQFDISYNQLVDLRKTESSVRSTAALREFANIAEQYYSDVSAQPKIAVVAPEDISFGLARMYEVFSDSVPWKFSVFRDIDTALEWLGVSKKLIDDIDLS